jgi:predicted nucleotidyltransferase
MWKATFQRYPHRDSIENFVARISAERPLLLILFGSVATGDFTESSDADVLVVLRDRKEWSVVYAHSDGIVQPVVMALPDLRKRIETGDSLVHEILRDGILLEGDELLWRDLLSEADRVARHLGMSRHTYGWSYKK